MSNAKISTFQADKSMDILMYRTDTTTRFPWRMEVATTNLPTNLPFLLFFPNCFSTYTSVL